jgi:hypothetical protein
LHRERREGFDREGRGYGSSLVSSQEYAYLSLSLSLSLEGRVEPIISRLFLSPLALSFLPPAIEILRWRLAKRLKGSQPVVMRT